MSPRLSLALDRGAVSVPPEGRIGVWGAVAGDDLSALPRDRVTVIQGFRPDHDAWAARGYTVVPEPEGRFALSVVMIPRAKDAARARIAAARAATDGPLLVDGAKGDGVDAIVKEIRARTGVGEVIAKAHGKIFAVPGGDFDDWAEGPPRRIAGGFLTRPGVFSADAPDPGSIRLAEALPALLGPRVADLGAGWGFLAPAILSRTGVAALDLVEADHVALACARESVTDPRARFHWADATTFAAEPFDTIVTNPPFHAGRAADPGLGRAFIAAAARLIAPRGELWLVANRHLPYEATLRATFRDVAEVGDDPSYKVFRASRPTGPR